MPIHSIANIVSLTFHAFQTLGTVYETKIYKKIAIVKITQNVLAIFFQNLPNIP